MRGAVAVAVFVLACFWHSPPGGAQESQKLKDRFNSGVALAKQKKYEEAVRIWLDVLVHVDEEAKPRVQKALGLAFRRLERLPEAWHYLTQYLKGARQKDTKAGAWLEQVEKKLSQKHKLAVISCEPEGVDFYLGETPTGMAYSCPLSWWFLPGKYQVHATRKGHQPATAEIDVRTRGHEGSFTIRLAAVKEEPTPVVVAPVEEEAAPDETITIAKPVQVTGRSQALEWTLIGSGAAVAVAGGIFHGMASSKNGDLRSRYDDTEAYPDAAEAKKLYNSDYDDKVLPMEITAYALYGLGGAAVATGVTMMLLERGPSGSDGESSLLMTPVALPEGAGAVVTIEF